MAKVLVVGAVENSASWEQSFRTHGDLFRSYEVVNSPIVFGANDNNEVAVLLDVSDVEKTLATLQSAENVEAMKGDKVKVDTVRVFVLDKENPF